MAYNGGVSGERSDQILARFDTDVAAYAPGYVIADLGTNDIVTNLTSAGLADSVVATVKENTLALAVKCAEIGARLILLPLPPVDGNASYQDAARDQLNAWIKSLAGVNDGKVFVPDINARVGSSAGPDWRSGTSWDGTHGSAIGCARMAIPVVDLLDSLIPDVDVLPSYQSTLNLCGNAFQSGTAGTKSTGVTGDVADGWTAANSGGSVTAVGSKVARDDGIDGAWQQYVVSAGTGIRHWRNLAGVVAGTTLQALIEFETDSDLTLATLTDFYAVLTVNAPSGNVLSYSMRNGDSDSLNDTACRIENGVMIVPPVTVPGDFTSASLNIHMTGATGTIRIGRVDVRAS